MIQNLFYFTVNIFLFHKNKYFFLVFLRSISEIIIVTNLKLHTFLKHAGCPRGEGGDKFGQ